MNSLIGLGMIGYMIYTILPSIWYRIFSRDTQRTVQNSQSVAITFDDGPDTAYTNAILEELKRLDLKATFFVLSSKVQRNKSVIQRMIKDGHRIELHGISHKCHWFYSKKATYRDVEESVKIAKENGIKPRYYRPPWGLYNIYTVPACKKNNLKCVHWTVHGYDWSKNITTHRIARRINRRIKKGDIILLHDSGKVKDAPEKTCLALELIVEKLEKKGLITTTIKEGGVEDGTNKNHTDEV